MPVLDDDDDLDPEDPERNPEVDPDVLAEQIAIDAENELFEAITSLELTVDEQRRLTKILTSYARPLSLFVIGQGSSEVMKFTIEDNTP